MAYMCCAWFVLNSRRRHRCHMTLSTFGSSDPVVLKRMQVTCKRVLKLSLSLSLSLSHVGSAAGTCVCMCGGRGGGRAVQFPRKRNLLNRGCKA